MWPGLEWRQVRVISSSNCGYILMVESTGHADKPNKKESKKSRMEFKKFLAWSTGRMYLPIINWGEEFRKKQV